MKEATGDMTMTIVVIVSIVAILTLGTTVIWPAIRDKISGEINNIGGQQIGEQQNNGGNNGGALGGGYIKLPDYFNN